MPAKLRELIAIHEQNARLTHYDFAVVKKPLYDAVTIVETFQQQHAAIAADPNLTPQGKNAARVQAGKNALEALGKWSTPRLAGLDQDLGTQRAALVLAGEKPDPRRVELFSSQLLRYTPEEIAVFYNAGTDEERLVMEAASASVGRMPMKTGNGLELRPLLNPETVNESVMARAAAKNPQGAQTLEELVAIRALHVTVAGHAVAEVREALSGILDA